MTAACDPTASAYWLLTDECTTCTDRGREQARTARAMAGDSPLMVLRPGNTLYHRLVTTWGLRPPCIAYKGKELRRLQ